MQLSRALPGEILDVEAAYARLSVFTRSGCQQTQTISTSCSQSGNVEALPGPRRAIASCQGSVTSARPRSGAPAA